LYIIRVALDVSVIEIVFLENNVARPNRTGQNRDPDLKNIRRGISDEIAYLRARVELY
jgi:hypothetical protein